MDATTDQQHTRHSLPQLPITLFYLLLPGEDALSTDHRSLGLQDGTVSVTALVEKKKKKSPASQNNSSTFCFVFF